MRLIETYLHRMVEMGGSDAHFKCDSGKGYIRVDGDLVRDEEWGLFTQEEFEDSLFSVLKPHQIRKFKHDLELDFAVEIPGLARFRGNCYQQRSHIQAAFRVIPYEIQTMEQLSLPPACYDFIERPRGLVLVTGPAGSGKSTTLAAMIDRINRTHPVHIMTVEDPVEFVHEDRVALINQRELEVDTNSFANALKHVLRQDPDVILVGEMRDLETIHLAITAAETGHLVFGTLHTVDAVQTVDRIVDVFPTHQQQQIRMQLSVNLIGVISQTLLRKSGGRGRVAAMEVMVATGAVRNQIRENKTYQIASLIQTGARAKMNTLDQSIAALVMQGVISHVDGREKAKDQGEFDRLLQISNYKIPEEGSAENRAASQPVTPVAPTSTPPASPPQPPPMSPPPTMQPQQAPPGTGGTVMPTQTGIRGQPNRPGFKR